MSRKVIPGPSAGLVIREFIELVLRAQQRWDDVVRQHAVQG